MNNFTLKELEAWSRILGGSNDSKDIEEAKSVIDRMKYLAVYTGK